MTVVTLAIVVECAILACVKATVVSPQELAGELLDLWTHLMRGSSQQMFVLLGELDLTMTQMKTLGMLEDCVEQVSVKELSERLGLSLPATSRTVDGLLRRGLLSRLEDTEDRRIKRVRLTDDGRAMVRPDRHRAPAGPRGLRRNPLRRPARRALGRAGRPPAQAEGPRMTDRIRLNEDNRRWWTLAAMCFALFMVMLDNTVVNVALPSIQKDLGATVSGARVDRQRLHAGVRRPAGHRRAPGRPVRAPAHVPLRRRRRSRRPARSSASRRARPGWSPAARSRASAPRS